ncbi:MAG TPA: nuclear transport factor 2 family protein [Actinomycetota bacterium]|nr:nuclear transport factor 2 family protein [Actinomycetota bacterium]
MPEAAETIRSLYEALARRDGEAAAACYAPDATFRDAAFRLSGADVGDMWRMLTERGKDLRIDYRLVGDDAAEWTADYTFQGHPVHNVIHSTFEFDDAGRIKRQVDTFDFPTWARQALGWKGRLLGRFTLLQAAVQKGSAASLSRWQRRRADRQSA